eukprot:SAG31_NODE_32509_length_355_cov_0.652344_1_plen_110_part_01
MPIYYILVRVLYARWYCALVPTNPFSILIKILVVYLFLKKGIVSKIQIGYSCTKFSSVVPVGMPMYLGIQVLVVRSGANYSSIGKGSRTPFGRAGLCEASLCLPGIVRLL